ncbi:peptidylprolyl isomerase [Gemmatimonadota bacterium]
MRRALVALGLVVLLGCGDGPSADTQIAARLDSWDLSVTRLAELLVLAQPFPLETEQVTPLVRHWVEIVAFATSVARGDSLATEELVRASSWNEIRQEVLAEFRAREFGPQIQVRPEDLDSIYFGTEVRAVAHVLRRAGPEATQEQRREQFAVAQEIRRRLVDGGPWEEANQLNQHVESRENGGLMVLRQDQDLPQITDVAFSLRPGELSQVFASPDGYHILVRPRLEEVRNAFANLLSAEESAGAEAVFVEALAAEAGLEIPGNAAEDMRRVAVDPLAEMESTRVLAEFEGGQLTAGQAARYLYLLPEEIRPELSEGPDWGLEDFVRQLALQELLWEHVERAGFELSDSTFAVIQERHLRDLERLREALDLSPEASPDPGRPREELERAAVRNVDLYFETVVARTEPLQPISPFLAGHLLRGADWMVDAEGIQEAISTARRLLDLAGYEEEGR